MGFGAELWGEYLQRHFPLASGQRPQVAHLSAEQVAQLLYPYLQAIGEEARTCQAAPTPQAVVEVDAALREVSISGTIEPVGHLSPEGLSELYDRLAWALAAAVLEENASSGWSVPVPLAAPDEVQAMAVFLSVLGGPGRDRPPQWKRQGSLGL